MKRTWLAALAVVATIGVQIPTQLATSGPAAAINGTEVVYAFSAFDSTFLKSATATCPAGKRLYGGGGLIVGGDGYVIMTHLLPINGWTGDHYQVIATEEATNNYPGNWQVESMAICGPALSNLQIVSATTNLPTNSGRKEVTVTCPAGTSVIGTGAAGGSDKLSINWIRPYPDGRVVVQVIRDLTLGVAVPNFSATAYAVCASPPSGYEIVAMGTILATAAVQTVTVSCPPAKTALGTGLTKTDPLGNAHPDAMFVTSVARTKVFTSARQVVALGEWAIGAWAICAY
jgi:hypothetical protein